MATEKILIFDEAGNAKRMKVRIARFLDNEPVTSSDKENIRTTLDVDGSQSGTFTTNLTTTQKLGAGTSSPSAPLSVESSSLPKATFGYGGSSAEHQLAWDSSKFNIAADAGNAVANSEIGFFVDGSKRFAINASGNLVVSSGGAIDFGSVAGGTGTPTPTTGGLLNDYETGTWAPVFTPQTGSFTTMTMDATGEYTKIGNMVHVRAYIRTNGVNLSGGSGFLYISGLPFTSVAKFSGISVGYATGWTNAPAGAYVLSGSSRIALTKRLTSITGSLYDSATTDLDTSSGLQNQIVIGGCYEAA